LCLLVAKQGGWRRPEAYLDADTRRAGPSGQVVGIDPLAERVALARERVPGVRFHIGYAEDLGAFADGSFDDVSMSSVFHWVPDKPKALAGIARVLRPGGKLGFTTLPWELRAAYPLHRPRLSERLA